MSSLALAGGALGWIGTWKGRLSVPSAVPIGLILGTLGGIGLWARCKGYARVTPEEGVPPRDLTALLPDKRVPLRTNGRWGSSPANVTLPTTR